jgi:regulator of protease activity HflC (stomatin/prohibitin superfamily)
MFLIIISIVVYLLSNRAPENVTGFGSLVAAKKTMRMAAIALFIIGILSSCVKQVDAGYIGVQSLFGKIQNRILPSGLSLINPLAQVREVDVRTQNYTMSGVHDEGEKAGDDAIRVLTKDGLEVSIDLSVLYRVNESTAPKLIRNIGVEFKDKIIRPVTRTKIRDNAVLYDAIELYSTKREQFQSGIFKSIDDEFVKRGLILENLLVRNITLPQTVKLTIESKINAEQDAQKMQFVLAKEKQEAERKRVEAQGIADYQHIISTGLTDKQLQYEQIKAYQNIATSENSKVIIMPNKSGNVILDAK